MKDLFKEYYALVIDRSMNEGVDTVAALLIDHWSYDLYERRPRPALLEEGVLKLTDLDLACFLAALVERKAVIALPTYKSRRARVEREGEMVTSKANRHGKCVDLTSNQEVFSFGVRIMDENVAVSGDFTESGEDETGAYRTFMLVDVDGTWHDGWKKIVFMPSRKENAFLDEKSLWTGNEVVFKEFVHPNRWVSFWGQYYAMTKVVESRLVAEASWLRTEVRRLRNEGVTLGMLGDDSSATYPKQEVVGADEPIKVWTVEAEVIPEVRGVFPKIPSTKDGLKVALERLHHVQYGLLPALRFPIRVTELAFLRFGQNTGGGMNPETGAHHMPPRIPAWIDKTWIEGNVKQSPRARTVWNRLAVPERPALFWRVMERTTRVASRAEGATR
jgi:hypothetical protein